MERDTEKEVEIERDGAQPKREREISRALLYIYNYIYTFVVDHASSQTIIIYIERERDEQIAKACVKRCQTMSNICGSGHLWPCLSPFQNL